MEQHHMLIAIFAFLQSKPKPEPAPVKLDPDVTASLVRTQTGGWEISLTGPASPSNWTADPDQLQLSLEAAGNETELNHPTLTFVKPNEAVQGAPIAGQAESTAGVPVTVSTSNNVPGFVRLKASGFVLASDSVSHKMISLPIHATDDITYIPATITPPAPAPGLRYFYLPDQKVDLRQEDGSAVPFDKAMLHELRLESIDTHSDGSFEAHFRLENWPKPVTYNGAGDPLAIPGLAPILWDDAARNLRIKYLNQPVWVYGGSLTAVSTVPGETAAIHIGVVQPIRIKKILRLYTRHIPLNVGPQIAALGGDTNSTFYTDCPIYVLLDIGKQGVITAAMGSSSDDMSKVFSRKTDLTGFQVVADDWQFDRLFSLKSGISQHPDWTDDMHKNVIAGKLKTGMTHAMVAWTMGWPGDPGTKKSMLAWSKWRYDIIKPYNFWVYFEGDKVVRFGEDGHPTEQKP
jgi:hypothetical protein